MPVANWSLGGLNAPFDPLISIENHSKQSFLLSIWNPLGGQLYIRPDPPMRIFQLQDLQDV